MLSCHRLLYCYSPHRCYVRVNAHLLGQEFISGGHSSSSIVFGMNGGRTKHHNHTSGSQAAVPCRILRFFTSPPVASRNRQGSSGMNHTSIGYWCNVPQNVGQQYAPFLKTDPSVGARHRKDSESALSRIKLPYEYDTPRYDTTTASMVHCLAKLIQYDGDFQSGLNPAGSDNGAAELA